LTNNEILIRYKDRSNINFLIGIGKHLNFEKCIIREKNEAKRHFLMYFITYSLLLFSKKKQVSCSETQKKLKDLFIKKILQNYGLTSQNLEGCEK
jgi:hypothetical protein